MLTTNSLKKYIEVKKLIAHGISKTKNRHFWHRESELAGHNFRMPNHLAALRISQIKNLSKFNRSTCTVRTYNVMYVDYKLSIT